MIYVRLERWPHGNRRAALLIGEMLIANVEGTALRADYRVIQSKEDGFKGGRLQRMEPGSESVLATGEVTGFPRAKKDAWHLLAAALRKVLPRPSVPQNQGD